MEEHHDRGPIEPQSRCDRAAIGAPAARNPLHDHRSTIPTHLEHDRRPIVRRSWPIVRRSWPIVRRSWPIFLAPFEEKFKPIRPEFEASTPLSANRVHDASIPRPRPPPSPTISGQFPSLKTHVLLLCSSTFDRLVKKLSEFRGRSLVHRVPPAFRLDCEAIGAGLITNFSLISSNFPLEFRTSRGRIRANSPQSTRIGAPSLRQSG